MALSPATTTDPVLLLDQLKKVDSDWFDENCPMEMGGLRAYIRYCLTQVRGKAKNTVRERLPVHKTEFKLTVTDERLCASLDGAGIGVRFGLNSKSANRPEDALAEVIVNGGSEQDVIDAALKDVVDRVAKAARLYVKGGNVANEIFKGLDYSLFPKEQVIESMAGMPQKCFGFADNKENRDAMATTILRDAVPYWDEVLLEFAKIGLSRKLDLITNSRGFMTADQLKRFDQGLGDLILDLMKSSDTKDAMKLRHETARSIYGITHDPRLKEDALSKLAWETLLDRGCSPTTLVTPRGTSSITAVDGYMMGLGAAQGVRQNLPVVKVNSIRPSDRLVVSTKVSPEDIHSKLVEQDFMTLKVLSGELHGVELLPIEWQKGGLTTYLDHIKAIYQLTYGEAPSPEAWELFVATAHKNMITAHGIVNCCVPLLDLN